MKLRTLWENRFFRGAVLMLFFGGLSLLLGLVRFNIPGFEGGVTDLREVAILLSVVFLPHWAFFIGVAFITSLTTPEEGSMLSTFIFQFCGMLFAYFVYRRWIRKLKNYIMQGLAFAGLVLVSYLLVMLPVMVLTYEFFNLVKEGSNAEAYFRLVHAVQFEMFVTAMVTALLFVSRNMRLSLRESNIELMKAKEKAEESDAIKTAFLQNISHEVRTPMNVINASVDLLLQGSLKEEDKEEISRSMEEHSGHLLRLLDQVIEFSRMETASSLIQKADFSLDELLEEIRSDAMKYRKFLKKEHVDFQIENPHFPGSFKLYSDKSMLVRLIVYLVENAFKFTQEGKVVVTLKDLDDHTMVFKISDTGPGIPDEHIDSVFERFYQSDPFTKGVGLSLSLSSKMAELLGGSVEIEKSGPDGTIFKVVLPLQ